MATIPQPAATHAFHTHGEEPTDQSSSGAAIAAVLAVVAEALSADRATLYVYSPGGRVSRAWTTEADPDLRRRIEATTGHDVADLPLLRWIGEQPEEVVALEDHALLSTEMEHISGLVHARAFIAADVGTRSDDHAGSRGALFVSFASPRRFTDQQRALVRHAARLAQLVESAVSDQEETVEALLMAEGRVIDAEWLGMLAEGSADMSVRCDPEGLVVQVSPACTALLGEDPDSYVGRPLGHLLGEPADGGTWADLVGRIAATPAGRAVVSSCRPGRAGEQVWLESTARVLRDADTGRLTELYTTTRDVTQRVMEERAVRHERDYAEALVGSMQDGLAVIGADGHLARTNGRLCEITGFSSDELVGSGAPFPFWPDEAVAEIREQVGGALARGGGEVDLSLCRADGERFPAIVSIAPFRGIDGVSSGYIATIKDVSERKKAVDGLRERAAEEVALRRVATVVAGDPDDPDAVFATVAREVAGLLGCESGAVVRFDDAGTGVVVGSYASVPGAVLPHGDVFTVEGSGGACEGVRVSGTASRVEHGEAAGGQVARWAAAAGLRSAVAAPIRIGGDELWGAVTVATLGDTPLAEDAEERLAHFADLVAMGITTAQERATRRDLEKSLRRAQKLEAVGQLAAGVAHEINTPVQYVSDSLHFLADGCASLISIVEARRQMLADAVSAGLVDASVAEAMRRREMELDVDYVITHAPLAIERARDGARRVGEIVGAMKEFARPSHDNRAPADINRAIEATAIMAQNAVKHVARLDVDLGQLPLVTCHVGDISRVVLNLITNAAHAVEEARAGSGEQGVITISTRSQGNEAIIEVADDGCGIPEDRLERIFELFFTTKAEGRGTGQGLSIVHTIVVDGHGGSISVDSEMGRGSTFRISLPLDGDRE